MIFLFKKTLAAGLALSITLAGTHGVFAQTTTRPPGPPPITGAPGANFAANQQKDVANIGQRIQILQTLQSCVQSATDHAGIKACHATARQSEQSLRH